MQLSDHRRTEACLADSPASPEGDDPLGPADFAACMAPLGPFETDPFLAVAVSGGADSLALALLADHWAKRQGGRVVGLVVDHGLRPGSAQDAEQTGIWLGARRIEHRILAWRGDKPSSGLQRRAREARYTLLADWCRANRCLHLLTAHHRADQAETVALRRARQSGAAGLAAMAGIREIPGLRLLRPLLGVDKARLTATLAREGQPWLDDPSNASPAFTRNRLRQTGLDIASLADQAAGHGARRRETDRRAAAALVRLARLDPSGFATLDAAGFARLEPELAADLLTRLLITVGGRVYPPRGRSLSRLLQEMHADAPESSPRRSPAAFRSCTLAHCRIQRLRDRWLICRERASPGRVPLLYGQRQRWDDRFVVTLATPRHGLSVGALGSESAHHDNLLIEKRKPRRLPAAVKPTLPAVWDGARLSAVPHLGLFDRSLDPKSLDMLFCPPTPLANAPFMPHISSLRRRQAVALLRR